MPYIKNKETNKFKLPPYFVSTDMHKPTFYSSKHKDNFNNYVVSNKLHKSNQEKRHIFIQPEIRYDGLNNVDIIIENEKLSNTQIKFYNK